MKVIVDRIEENFAVCEMENGNMLSLSMSILPSNIKDGTVLDIQGQIITVDEEQTEKKRKAAERLLDDLF